MYKIIYADPPWSYRDKQLAGNRGAACKYDTMSIDSIARLPIGQLADRDCCLFMWVTMPMLNECWQIIRSWGFDYKTVAFTWVKRNRKTPSWFWGMGSWTRANAEVCLLATRGKPQRQSASVHSIVDTPIQLHSQKPQEVRDRIVQLCGDVPRIELFARTNTPGWDAWGNQVTESIELPEPPVRRGVIIPPFVLQSYVCVQFDAALRALSNPAGDFSSVPRMFERSRV